MKAIVDKDVCISCGLCVETWPEVFELDDDEKAQAKVNPVPPEQEAACRDAEEQCPVEAITLEA